MSTIVIMPGGFHPFHAGHMALYQSAVKAFPGAEVYVAASNDTSERPFPFAVKEKLAKVSGVPAGHFLQVKSPFRPNEITDNYDPNSDILVFVRSEKDRNEQPKPGGTKKDGTPAYFQPYTGKNLKPFSQHAYMAYLPTVEFGPGITSATEIRNAWTKLNDKRKLAMVMSLYPATQKNEKLGKNVVAMLDSVIGAELNEMLGFKIVKIPSKVTKPTASLADMRKEFEKDKPLDFKKNSNNVDPKNPKYVRTITAEQGVAEGSLNEFSQGDFNGGDDSNDLQLYLNVAKKLNMKKYKPSTAHNLIVKKMAELVDAVDDEKVDYARHMARKAQGLPNMLEQGVAEARTNPDQNVKSESGMKELQAVAKTISDPENWAISMTSEPKLGINPQVGISEDTPKGIYFYPLDYALDKTRYGTLPWGHDYPYIQLFQYDRSGEMTQQTQVDPNKLKQALSKYCSDEIMQQAAEEDEYDGTPYYFIYDCLSRLGKSDETNVVRWNKVLRDLGFTSVYDPGKGWIAHNEPTQGVVLDPRIIKQHKTISNRQQARVVTPAKIEQTIFDTMDMELAASRSWQAYDPDGSKLRAAAKEYAKDPRFKPWLGKPGTEEIYDKAEGMGRYGARQLSDEAWEWFKAQQAQQKVDEDKNTDPVTSAVLSFYKPVVNDIHKEKLPDYVDQARELLQKTNDPEVRSKLVDIFKKGKENPYIQGGIVTTVGALLAGGVLSTAQQMGLNPAQTNLALQAILNTVIPTVVSRINGKSWSDTIKYTLASAGIGTGIAGASLTENADYLEEK